MSVQFSSVLTQKRTKKAILLVGKKNTSKQKQQHYENIQYVFDVVCFNTVLFYFFFLKKLNFKTGNDVEG